VALVAIAALLTSCGRSEPPQTNEEGETIARTEFTDRIENFFEYDPLVSGQTSRFLIHLTDLSDGSPVEQADVTVVIRGTGDPQSTAPEVKARVGRVTGIYVAEITVPRAGAYDLEFRIRNAKLDERMSLTGFAAQ
jgi:hypothetical protein